MDKPNIAGLILAVLFSGAGIFVLSAIVKQTMNEQIAAVEAASLATLSHADHVVSDKQQRIDELESIVATERTQLHELSGRNEGLLDVAAGPWRPFTATFYDGRGGNEGNAWTATGTRTAAKWTVQWHTGKVQEMHMRRVVMRDAMKLQDDARDVAGKSVDEIRSAIEQMAMSTAEIAAGSGLVDGMVSSDWYSRVEARQKNPSSAYGMKTGWRDLDELTLGFHRGDLIIVGGRTSVGKSAFANETIIRLQAYGHKIAVFSLEMSMEQIHNRIASNISGVALSKIRTGEMSEDELLHVSNTMGILGKIAIDDERGVTADYIAAEMKRWKRTRGLDFVVVDYLQESVEPYEQNDNSGSAYGRIARKLRTAAQKCDCAVMALSQLSREAEGSKPKVKHLSGSAGIESAADVIILLHRDKEEHPDVLEVDLAKQRNGPTGEVNMTYDRTHQRIIGIHDSFR